MSLTNVWHLRTVADTSSKSCCVCYKPTTGVLITPDNKDFFYTCRGHLKDKGFCSPLVDEAEKAAKEKQAQLEREIELVKKEYDERLKKKQAKKDKNKDKGKDSKKEDKDDKEADEAEKEKEAKIKALTNQEPSGNSDDEPRIFVLHRSIFQMRLDRIRNAEMSKRNRERLQNPYTFPSVPKGNP